MQICDKNITKLSESFSACMDNKELILLYAMAFNSAPTATLQFIQDNFPTYAAGFYIDPTNQTTDDCDKLFNNLQAMLIEQGFISTESAN